MSTPLHDTVTRVLRLLSVCASIAPLLLAARVATAQPHVPARVDVAWNRYYTFEQCERILRDIAAAYPGLVTLRSIGTSWEGRDIHVATVAAPGDDDPDDPRPAMWIDGSIHANEIQATEVVLYSIWYLTKMYGVNPRLTALLDNVTFHFCPVVNPDSRVAWFERPATPHAFRYNQRPIDSDRDGLVDEDAPHDLDGDGSITRLWRQDPGGEWIRDRFDDRIFRRVPPGERGDWTSLGAEGIDQDGDGRSGEDGPGGYDMNRNWPGDWQPDYVQGGAGSYPLSSPETRAIAGFIMARPEIGAAQAYHNTGGMILRGPGAEARESFYPGPDRTVYDQIAKDGEKMLPYYRALVIWKDLYRVHGGFVTWLSESLGIFGFTNELWTVAKYFQNAAERPDEDMMRFFRDHLEFGQTWTDYSAVDHPEHGEVLVGGANKWSSRATPTFMLEEECHRNFAFSMYHADQLPRLEWGRLAVQDLGSDLWQITAEIRNTRMIPTRSSLMQSRNIGTHDRLETTPATGRVVTGGRPDTWWSAAIRESRFEPERLLLPDGVPSRGTALVRVYVEAPAGTEVTLAYRSARARDLVRTLRLGD